ncbi:sugar phosphate isomerase/epimerase family protein [Chitinophaga arvensicola]|uniref:Sugar phosphate isomerase/epimerase n=1 Tax=Chitinophaga arvensicola TaxID=29529 RepID=A0A1I0SBD3_9BACT|nr:TIM barrel protein [Chitinophaga arvensicola]SEW53968.1 Sugar phosphate isomerase/epimerase [Chitinophaga arvensicola]
MQRRTFLLQSSGLLLSVWMLPAFARPLIRNKMDRIGMGTVLMRYRFKQTKPKELAAIKEELTLLEVPQYYRDRFQVSKLEFWSNHFESLDTAYIQQLKGKIKASRSQLVNVQVDSNYDLAATDETERQRSLQHVKEWMDAVSLLGSQCVRINPGHANGSVEKSIASMKEVNKYAKRKHLILLTENHFGIEMNPDTHLQIVKAAGPGNIYTLPDFGNYPTASMFASLEKILPYAGLISAKAMNFNANMEHISYDFDRCVRMTEKAGFKGVYSVEQWSPDFQDIDYAKVGDWLIQHVSANI